MYCYSLYFSICLKFFIIRSFFKKKKKLSIKIEDRSQEDVGWGGRARQDKFIAATGKSSWWPRCDGGGRDGTSMCRWGWGGGCQGTRVLRPRGHLPWGSAPSPRFTSPTARAETGGPVWLSHTTPFVGEGTAWEKHDFKSCSSGEGGGWTTASTQRPLLPPTHRSTCWGFWLSSRLP